MISAGISILLQECRLNGILKETHNTPRTRIVYIATKKLIDLAITFDVHKLLTGAMEKLCVRFFFSFFAI